MSNHDDCCKTCINDLDNKEEKYLTFSNLDDRITILENKIKILEKENSKVR